ncbi:MAG TPA: hypothetical protein VFR51_11365 [Pyrinomonadaceae bacterium]|nr:hypothetical protein [Pyrinomonadaceae bacterium]
MKQCPKCRQLFANDDLRFCRFDGSRLLSETLPLDEGPTILLLPGQLINRFTPREELPPGSKSGKLYE